mgnify:CR=1 FL=1
MIWVIFLAQESEILPFLTMVEFCREGEANRVGPSSRETLGQATSRIVMLDYLDIQRTLWERGEVVPRQGK